jgi:hypothetical protein
LGRNIAVVELKGLAALAEEMLRGKIKTLRIQEHI